tara:strand:+ start:73 stop:714 length:642 start_codon:yes stop_codon:yes gene_type:complete
MNALGGMSISNSFMVEILEDDGKIAQNNIFEFLCDEAQLPNIQAATGTIEGRYVGEGQVNYPHTRVFTEVQLGFQCDANLIPLKYLNNWYGKIFGEVPVEAANTFDNRSGKTKQSNRTNKLTLPESYCKTIRITKTEIGPPTQPLRPSITYLLERAWPFAIDAVPLQFGSTLITKVTAQFYYTRHTIIHNDITQTVPIPINPVTAPPLEPKPN